MDEPNLFELLGANDADQAKAARIAELEGLIDYHRDRYYNHEPEIPDDVFNAFVDELQDLDPNNPKLQDVGAPVPKDSGWETARHNIAMTSLDKVNTIEQARAWVARIYSNTYCIEEKLDGFGISVDYVDGVLQRAVTRGGGEEGEDITRNVIKMQGIRPKLPTNYTGTLRGETMFFAHDFEAYNREAAAKGWKVFKNMRNGAAGLARRTSGEGVHYLRVLFYDLKGNVELTSQVAKLAYLRNRLELWTPWFARVVGFDLLVTVFQQYAEKRPNLPYEIDGMVVKADSLEEAEDIETTLQKSNRDTANPKSQMAWKFEDEGRVTTLKGVSFDFGLGGKLTPVAELEPVPLGGVTITRASLHNMRNVRELGVRLGSKVLIKRANDVIPQVVRVLEPGTGPLIEAPTECPSCKTAIVTVGEFLVCRNASCAALISGNIRKWINGLGVDYFGMSVIEELVAKGKLTSIIDLYTLDEKEIGPLVGKGVAKRALENLHAKKVVPLHAVIGSLNIPSFGHSLSKVIVAAGYDSIEKVLDATILDFAKLDGFDVKRATDVWNGLRQYEDVLEQIGQHLVIQSAAAPVAGSGPLSGKSFCITGSLSQPKKVFEKIITDAGGVYESSVKKGLSYLVTESKDSNSDKAQKARKLGIPVIDEAELLTLAKG